MGITIVNHPMIKSLWVFLFIAISAIPTAAAIPTIRIVNQPLSPGKEVPVELLLDNPVDVAGVQMVLLYDPWLVQPIVSDSTFQWEREDGVMSGFMGMNYEYPTALPGKKGIAFYIVSFMGVSKSGRLLRL